MAKKKERVAKKKSAKASARGKSTKPAVANLLESISTKPLGELAAINGTVTFDRQYSVLTETQGIRSLLLIYNPSGPNPDPQGFGPTTAFLEFQLGKTDNDPLVVDGFRTMYGSTRVICCTRAQ